MKNSVLGLLFFPDWRPFKDPTALRVIYKSVAHQRWCQSSGRKGCANSAADRRLPLGCSAGTLSPSVWYKAQNEGAGVVPNSERNTERSEEIIRGCLQLVWVIFFFFFKTCGRKREIRKLSLSLTLQNILVYVFHSAPQLLSMLFRSWIEHLTILASVKAVLYVALC